MASCRHKSVLKMASCYIILSLFLLSSSISSGEAYVSHNQKGNITIKWDIIQWTPDGYTAVVNIYNFQLNYPIQAPGWTLGWTWAMREVIWSMYGAQTTGQEGCSRFIGNIPVSCKKAPTVVDLPRGTPYNLQIGNCCKGGVLKSWNQDPANAVSAFQITVGATGTTKKTVHVPKKFTFKAPGSGYICGRTIIVRPTRFISPDGKRIAQAIMTWRVVCTHFKLPAQ